jgi:cell division septation protein DedD
MNVKAFAVATVVVVFLLSLDAYTNDTSGQPSYTFVIKENGDIDPPAAPILVQGNVYTLTANLSGGIQVRKNNSVIDGAGYTVSGNGGIGLNLPEVTNVTVKNVHIENCSVGVHASGMTNCTFYACNVANCSQECFFLIGNCSYNTITRCTLIGLNPISMNYMSNYNVINENNITGTVIIWLSGYETFDRNFWSDYFARYPNATEIGSSGIGDTPYLLAPVENSAILGVHVDNHPLVRPAIISNNSVPSSAPSMTPTSSPPAPSPSPVSTSAVTPSPTPSPSIPEFAVWIILPFAASAVLAGALLRKRRRNT